MVAPIAQATPSELEQVKARVNYERFPLEPGIGFCFSGGIVDLRRAFMIDKRALRPDQRVTTLQSDIKELLEVRWSAFTTRRGPEVFNRNAIKLARLLAGDAEPTAEAKATAASVADVLGLAWRLEANDLENAATAWDDKTSADPEVAQLIETLHELEAATIAARAGLEAHSQADERVS